MILEMHSMTIPEVTEALKGNEEKQELVDYLKKFSSIKGADAVKMKEELVSLDNVKLKDEYITKLVDFIPRDAQDVHRIFTDVSLDEKEVQDILGIVGNYGK